MRQPANILSENCVSRFAERFGMRTVIGSHLNDAPPQLRATAMALFVLPSLSVAIWPFRTSESIENVVTHHRSAAN